MSWGEERLPRPGPLGPFGPEPLPPPRERRRPRRGRLPPPMPPPLCVSLVRSMLTGPGPRLNCAGIASVRVVAALGNGRSGGFVRGLPAGLAEPSQWRSARVSRPVVGRNSPSGSRFSFGRAWLSLLFGTSASWVDRNLLRSVFGRGFAGCDRDRSLSAHLADRLDRRDRCPGSLRAIVAEGTPMNKADWQQTRASLCRRFGRVKSPAAHQPLRAAMKWKRRPPPGPSRRKLWKRIASQAVQASGSAATRSSASPARTRSSRASRARSICQ
jgi:hypothetical protein